MTRLQAESSSSNRALIGWLTGKHSVVYLNISEVFGVDLVWVIIQHGEICVFSDLNRSKAIVSVQNICGIDSDRAKSAVNGDPFAGCEHRFSVGTYSVYRTPSGQQR